METVSLNPTTMISSRLVYGCMRITGDNSAEDLKKGEIAINTALDQGYNHFDLADIYGGGECEKLFGKVLKQSSFDRESLIITSKAGIRRANSPLQGAPTRYDFSKQYLIKAVEDSLKRLNIDYLDLFLLHRPDYLMAADEVAEVFELLKTQGKVRHFGVSNFSVSQLNLLQSRISMPLIVNQIEINLHNVSALENGMLDYCQQYQISPQAWCPVAAVAYPAWGNTFSKEDEIRLHTELTIQAAKYDVEPWLIALAWLLIHPAKICPIIGSTTASRVIEAKKALDLNYTREDWYRLFEARNGVCVP